MIGDFLPHPFNRGMLLLDRWAQPCWENSQNPWDFTVLSWISALADENSAWVTSCTVSSFPQRSQVMIHPSRKFGQERGWRDLLFLTVIVVRKSVLAFSSSF